MPGTSPADPVLPCLELGSDADAMETPSAAMAEAAIEAATAASWKENSVLSLLL